MHSISLRLGYQRRYPTLTAITAWHCILALPSSAALHFTQTSSWRWFSFVLFAKNEGARGRQDQRAWLAGTRPTKAEGGREVGESLGKQGLGRHGECQLS
jgi:hypothetical protein